MKSIEINSKDLAILNNFKTIQPHLVMEKGNTVDIGEGDKKVTKQFIQTISGDMYIRVTSAVVDFAVDNDMGIRNLGEILQSMKLLDSPTLKIEPEFLTITSKSGLESVKAFFSPISCLTYLDKPASPTNFVARFELTNETIKKMKSASSTLSHHMVNILSNDGDIRLIVTEKTEKQSNHKSSATSWDTTIPGEYVQEFDEFLHLTNLKILPLDYDVKLATQMINKDGKILECPNLTLKSKNPEYDITYIVILELNNG